MVRTLLIRGMLVGIVAGLLAFGMAKIFGEPQVDRAIAFEESTRHDDAMSHDHAASGAAVADTATTTTAPAAPAEEEELVSRGTQSGIGLLTGVVVYGTAFGGLFALVFAFAMGRVGPLGPRATAALLAAAVFIAVIVVPGLKYPPNPPAVGDGATISYRTGLYFAMLAISVAAAVAMIALAGRLAKRHGVWNAAIIGGAGFVVIVVVAQLLLPALDEVPDTFPAVVLWRFRIASLGIQLVMWTAIGLLFGMAAERVLSRPRLPAAAR